MDIRNETRRKMPIGFSTQRDQEGHVIGAIAVRLAPRNAYELVGLRRPVRRPMPMPKVC
jgi:hypothetical protein